MLKLFKMASSVILLSLVSVVAQAGIIGPNDGLTWELRGSKTNVADHRLEAPSDTGWTWATSSQWLASGLDGIDVTTQALLDEYEGVCDGTRYICDGFLADVILSNPRFQRAVRCTFCPELFGGSKDRYNLQSREAGSLTFRLSFSSSSTSVPEPTSLALLGLGLLGMGLARRGQNKA